MSPKNIRFDDLIQSEIFSRYVKARSPVRSRDVVHVSSCRRHDGYVWAKPQRDLRV